MRGLIEPESEVVTLIATCFGRRFSFSLTNHRLRPSALGEARLDGRPPRDRTATVALRQFLAGSRRAHFQGATCLSRQEISIGLGALRYRPSPGEGDDLLQVFRVRF